MSAHRKRQRQLEAQIAELENRALGKKDWQMSGEVVAVVLRYPDDAR